MNSRIKFEIVRQHKLLFCTSVLGLVTHFRLFSLQESWNSTITINIQYTQLGKHHYGITQLWAWQLRGRLRTDPTSGIFAQSGCPRLDALPSCSSSLAFYYPSTLNMVQNIKICTKIKWNIWIRYFFFSIQNAFCFGNKPFSLRWLSCLTTWGMA